MVEKKWPLFRGRMIAAVQAGEDEYHRYLAEDLGFTWLPLGQADADER